MVGPGIYIGRHYFTNWSNIREMTEEIQHVDIKWSTYLSWSQVGTIYSRNRSECSHRSDACAQKVRHRVSARILNNSNALRHEVVHANVICLYWIIYIAGHGLGYQLGIWTPNLMATLYCTKNVPISRTQTQILIQIQIPDHYCTHFWDGHPYSHRDQSPCLAMQISHRFNGNMYKW